MPTDVSLKDISKVHGWYLIGQTACQDFVDLSRLHMAVRIKQLPIPISVSIPFPR
jgi:hypothetical protein